MKIKLTNGMFVLVDVEDFEFLNQWKWDFDGRYARRREKGVKIYMHRVINNTPPGKHTDHINRDKLDNRRSNLRAIYPKWNTRNTGIRDTNRSGHTGIWFWKERNKWEAYISADYKKIHLGLFKDMDDAIEARKQAERIYWV